MVMRQLLPLFLQFQIPNHHKSCLIKITLIYL
uniref:Uncharacterized protein n=1 Tax=Rhizophora mucronata TaxID=61149 RepID=A0A2P2JF74_RHIMU